MFAYGSLVPRDIPARVTVRTESQTYEWDVNNDFGVIVTPNQEVLRVMIIHRPSDPKDMPGFQKPMRLLTVIPWERILNMDIEYAGPPKTDVIDEAEKEALRDALEVMENEGGLAEEGED